MNAGNNVVESEYPNVRASNSLANPGWWTIKRWSEFMWYTRQIVLVVKSTFGISIAPYVRRIAGR